MEDVELSRDMHCPACGAAQVGGEECRRCGIIFGRYRRGSMPRPPNAVSRESESRTSRDAWRLGMRLLRWGAPLSALLACVLMLQNPALPAVAIDSHTEEQLAAKLDALQTAVAASQPHLLQLDEPELNALVRHVISESAAGDPRPRRIRDITLRLEFDRIRVYAHVDVHSRPLLLTLEGRIDVKDGRLLFHPSGGRVGMLPLPGLVLGRVADHISAAAQPSEAGASDSHMHSIGVRNHHLWVEYR
jgi:hypothetical protein